MGGPNPACDFELRARPQSSHVGGLRSNFALLDGVCQTSPMVAGLAEDHNATRRAGLVDHLRFRRDLTDPRVEEAFRRVPRHLFVPEALESRAYEDRALPLTEGQTISQPTMLAVMLEALRCEPQHRVLEIGAGSGYAAALLAELAAEVHTVEVRPALIEWARSNLARAQTRNVTVHAGDGNLGLKEWAPFHRIIVSAGAPQLPPALVEQLAAGGRMVIPLDAPEGDQVLAIGERQLDGSMTWRNSILCSFVPLISGATLAPS